MTAAFRISLIAFAALFFGATASSAQDCVFGHRGDALRLSEALNSRDHVRISERVRAINPRMRAPIPEKREPLIEPAEDAFSLEITPSMRQRAVRLYLDAVRNDSWWLQDPTPTPPEIPRPLRRPAEMIRGLIAVALSYPDARAEALDLAAAAADYLVGASREAGVRYAPFPYWRNKPGRLGELSERMARALEACGELEANIRNGWFTVAAVPEEYFFDTGLAGEALAKLARYAPQDRYTAWLSAASDWLAQNPLSPNFNYNAFPAQLHAATFVLTGDGAERERAMDRLTYGVIPGMIAQGEDTGHWIDPHNERLAYRAIMVRSMIETRLAIERAGPGPQRDAARDLASAIESALGAMEGEMSGAVPMAILPRMIEIYTGIDALAENGILIPFSMEVRASFFALAKQYLVQKGPSAGAGTGVFLALLNKR